MDPITNTTATDEVVLPVSEDTTSSEETTPETPAEPATEAPEEVPAA